MNDNQAQENGVCSPSGMKVLHLQVGGHRYGKNGKKVGMLDRGNGVVLKALQAPPRGARELALYQSVFSPTCTDSDLLKLREFLPHFYGTEKVDGATCLVMRNLAFDFASPNILDLKMGQVTFDPEATPEKREHEKSKYPPLQDLGFQITGMMMHDPVSGRAESFDKPFCRSLTAETMLTQGLGKFFGLQYGHLRKDVISALLSKLRQIEKWFQQQKKLAFYASSLLIVFSGFQSQDSITNQSTACPQEQGRMSDDDLTDQDSRTDQSTVCVQGKRRLAGHKQPSEGHLKPTARQKSQSLRRAGLASEETHNSGPVASCQTQPGCKTRGSSVGSATTEGSSSKYARTQGQSKDARGERSRRPWSENSADTSCSANRDSADTSCPANKDSADTSCSANRDSADTSCLANRDSADTSCPANRDSADTSCPAIKDSADTSCPANKDSADTSCPANKDSADTSCRANKDRTDTSCPANRDSIDTSCTANKERAATTCSSAQTACVEFESSHRNAALVEVRMIDFAHVFPSSARDDNYLFGLQRLISFLEKLLNF